MHAQKGHIKSTQKGNGVLKTMIEGTKGDFGTEDDMDNVLEEDLKQRRVMSTPFFVIIPISLQAP